MRAAYDELVDELLEERSEALRIAQAYKAELERVQISDDDIQSLDATIARVLEIFVSMQSDAKNHLRLTQRRWCLASFVS